ncbi:tRNA-guanine transglycosylase, partial [archaeon]
GGMEAHIQQQLLEAQARIQELSLLADQIKRGEKRGRVEKRRVKGGGEVGMMVREHVHISSAKFRDDPRPLDASCGCYTCQSFSRGYLHHLFKAGESVGGTLVTLHNVHFMNTLMRRIR